MKEIGKCGSNAVVLLFFAATFPLLSFCQEYTPFFRQANKHYSEGDFSKAAAEYEVLAENFPWDPYIHYNLANAYFKLGKLGRSIAEYTRAFAILPRDPDIRDNLDFTLRRAGDSLFSPDIPRPLVLSFYWLSLNELEGIQWIMFWIAMLLACAYVLMEIRRGRLLLPLVVSAFLWAIPAAWWGARLAVEPSNPGVTLVQNVEVRNGPGENFSVGFTAPEGRMVEILQEHGEWLEIGVLKEGLQGWAKKAEIEKI